MKKFLLIFIITSGFIFENSFAQGIYGGLKTGSAYKTMHIESYEAQGIRKSHDYNVTYSTYNGVRSYVKADFKYDRELAYSLFKNGIIYDYKLDIEGTYCVGEKCGHETYKVYIRWEHGGETWGTLKYSRYDGKPSFTIYKAGAGYTYQSL